MSDLEAVRLEEYRSLMEEHHDNRKLMFERPLIILGSVVVALEVTLQFLYATATGQLLLGVMIFILIFNLWFTSHRFRSDARIVAYLQLFHEGALRDRWIGWETALLRYRKWISVHLRAGDLEQIQRKYLGTEPSRSDSIETYPMLWCFHLVLVGLIAGVCLIRTLSNPTTGNQAGLVFSTGWTLIFLWFAFGRFFFKRPERGIDRARANWIEVTAECGSRELSVQVPKKDEAVA